MILLISSVLSCELSCICQDKVTTGENVYGELNLFNLKETYELVLKNSFVNLINIQYSNVRIIRLNKNSNIVCNSLKEDIILIPDLCRGLCIFYDV